MEHSGFVSSHFCILKNVVETAHLSPFVFVCMFFFLACSSGRCICLLSLFFLTCFLADGSALAILFIFFGFLIFSFATLSKS